ncbi:MAG TPA: MBL fold metallo-hydrolase [Rhodocyclaceae bacterium]|nr:MBL fold metallo-hydrolase [Rhodocyclaceae bacterium]
MLTTRPLLLSALIVSVLAAATPAQAQTLPEAAKQLGVEKTTTLEFTGAGRWFQFGQAPAPNLPWPPFTVSKYEAAINFAKASSQVQIARQQVEEPNRYRPAPTPQWANQFVNGKTAWNLPLPHLPQTPTLQPAAVEERQAEIWSTPQGFVKAALANNATVKPVKDGAEVSFTLDGKYHYEGKLNSKSQVEWVKTWIDTPVLGDTLLETRFSDYKDFGDVRFPAHIVRAEGGYPVLDLTVSSVKANGAGDIAVPAEVTAAKVAPATVKCTRIGDGVYYLTGGTHHSVAIEQRDYVVLIEAPLNEERSLALIEKLKEVVPNKPIKYVVNTHAHFDHSGGLRTFVDAGATIVTTKANQAYYQKTFAAPHTLNPDRLEQSKKPAKFQTFLTKDVLTDGNRDIEIFALAGSAHNDAFAVVYLPWEKILVEADAFTPTAADAPLPASPNPYSVNLYENIQKLKLDVRRIAALHGPRLVSLEDLKAAIGQ